MLHCSNLLRLVPEHEAKSRQTLGTQVNADRARKMQPEAVR